MSDWWSWMSAMSVQVLVVVAVVALLERALARRVRPRLAAALWTVALLKLAAPPTLGSPVSVARLLPSDAPSAAAPDFVAAAFWTWLAGVALFSILAVRRHVALRRDLLSRAVPAAGPPGLRTFVVRGLDVPCVFGYFRPVILVPEGTVDPHALLHEATHIRRRDPLKGLAALVAQVVYWFHPAAWWIRSRLSTLREVGCDADAARSLGDRAPEYRRMLAEVARRWLQPAVPGATALAIGKSRLVERLEWLRTPRPGSLPGRIAAPLAAGLVLAACVPLARPAVAPFAWPKLEATRGCLQRRFVVLEALSHQPDFLEKRP